MRITTVRRGAAAAAVLVALAGLTSCSSDDSTATDPAGEPTTSSSTDGSDDTSTDAAPAPGDTVDPSTFFEEVSAGMAEATTAHLSMTMAGGPAAVTLEGDVDYTTDPPEMAMTMANPAGGGDISILLVDGVMYMQMGDLGGGKWIKMDMTGTDSPLGEGLMDQLDPGSALGDVEGGVDEVTFVGDEEVDGETLQHYSMKVRSKAFGDLQDELGTTAGSSLPSVVTYDVWLDDQGLVRRSELAMGDLGSVTVEMTKWGDPVDISAPPASDVLKTPPGWMVGSSGV